MASSQDFPFTFTWIIENINSLTLYFKLETPKFVVKCLDNTEWKLGCVLRPDEKENGKIKKYLQLIKVPTEPYNLWIDYEFSLFDAHNEKLQTLNVWGFRFHRGNCVGESEFGTSKEFLSKIRTIRCRMSENRTKCCDTEQSFGRIRIGIERRHFKWTIKNVSKLEKKTTFITVDSKKCPSKSINLLINTSRICGRKVQVELRNDLAVDEFGCECRSYPFRFCDPYPCIQDCQISIVDSKENVMIFPEQEKWKQVEEMEFRERPKGKNHDKYYFQFPLNTTNNELAEICVQNDSLSFHCECEISFGVELNQLEDINSTPMECRDNTETLKECCKIATSSTSYMKDMQQLCVERKFCDFNLKTDKEIFPVHRAILSVRSPVFKAMFSHDMKEDASQSADIPDLNADTVRRMLLYIYTDKVENILWKDAFDLYIAGDKYQMSYLKERCSSILKSSLLPSNACQILVLADDRQDEDLKKAAEDYIVDHDAEIIRLDAWKDIEGCNPKLGVDILRQMVLKRQNV